MDLHSVLPDFPTAGYARIIATLEKAGISVKELLLLDALEIAKQTQTPVTDVRRLARDVLDALHKDLGVHRYQENDDDAELLFKEELSPRCAAAQPLPALLSKQRSISILDPVLDAALAGGIRTGYLTEIAGESGCGKTQLLLHLLLAVQLPPPHGLSQGALYISTEGDLPTTRLAQLLSNNPLLSSPPGNSPQPSLENIHSITTIDLESQDHIINFQVPVAIERYNIGLVVVDSITANYRAELSADNPEGLVARARELKTLGHFLRNLAVKYNVAVVVANQVSDQFETLDDPMWTEAVDEISEDISLAPPLQQRPQPSSIRSSRIGSSQSSPTPMAGAPYATSSPLTQNGDDHSRTLNLPSLDTVLALDHQKPFFTGWGDPYSWLTRGPQPDVKASALGLVWTNQIACRVILKIKPDIPSIILPPPEKHQIPQVQPESRPPLSAPLAVVPDSEDSDGRKDETGCVPKADDELGIALPVSRHDPSLSQLQVAAEGAATEDVPDKRIPPIEGTADTLNNPIPTSQDDPFASTMIFNSRRIRVIEVVFSPWTSGSAHQHLGRVSSDDEWDDVDEREVEGTQELVTKYEPSSADTVEFEILEGGVRGLP